MQTELTYDFPNGALKQFTYGNGIVHTLAQNARQLPDRSRDLLGATVIHDDSYDYDATGNVVAITDGRSGSPGNRDMTYDGLDRLKTASGGWFGGTISYSYDVLDNIATVTKPGTGQVRYCYDSNLRLDLLRTGSTNCTNGAATDAFDFDAQGNLTNKNGQGYSFSLDNRLRWVTGKEYYRYDGHGRRAQSWNPTLGNITWFYGQDGALRYMSSARTQKNETYVYLSGSLVAIRETPVPTGAATVKYQHTDALGTPVAVTDAAGNVLERASYDPFGKQLSGPVKDGPGYTGHAQDVQTGLTYMQQRYFDSAIGLLLSVDPVAVRMVGDNFNRYWYANDNPYRFTDPDGRETAMFQGPDYQMAQPNPEAFTQVLGLIADFTPVVGDAKGIYEAFQRPTWTNITAAGVGLVPIVGDAAGKAIKNADHLVDAGQATSKATRAENIAGGIPESQVGPSGKPKIHVVDHGGKRGEAKEAARRENGKGGSTTNHTGPKVGKDHYHGTSQSGEKSRVHHEYD